MQFSLGNVSYPNAVYLWLLISLYTTFSWISNISSSFLKSVFIFGSISLTNCFRGDLCNAKFISFYMTTNTFSSPSLPPSWCLHLDSNWLAI